MQLYICGQILSLYNQFDQALTSSSYITFCSERFLENHQIDYGVNQKWGRWSNQRHEDEPTGTSPGEPVVHGVCNLVDPIGGGCHVHVRSIFR